MNQVLAGRTLTPESSYMFCRYVFRVLEMMKDYFAGRPFRKKYPMFSRYKFELEPEYLNFTNEFRDWLKLEPQTILGLYSIARDFAYYLQQNGLHDFSAIDQETLYSFMTWEYETHPATLDRIGYCLRLICQFLNQKVLMMSQRKYCPLRSLPKKKRFIHRSPRMISLKSLRTQIELPLQGNVIMRYYISLQQRECVLLISPT